MKSVYSVKCFQEGRGKPSVNRFATLNAASEYIQNRWQGAEYCHGTDNFNTDYSSYELSGFTLSDIGTFTYKDGYRHFVFTHRVSATSHL